MGYGINAFLASAEVFRPLVRNYRSACSVLLDEGICLVPLVEALQTSIQARRHDPEADPSWPFWGLSRAGAQLVRKTCPTGAMAYVEAEFYGGAGHQSSVGWRDGEIAHGPIMARDAINQALRFLGVTASNGHDEFDTVGLGRHRSTEEWFDP
jgi:hypothetical protein